MHQIHQKVRRNRWQTLGLFALVALIFVLPQIFNHSLLLGTDYNFHFNRIYDAAMQLKHHQFSYMQSNYGFDQSGRIVGALYGPLGTYVLGGLLLLTGSWFRFQIVSSWLVALIAACGMYRLARTLGVSRTWARTTGSLFVFLSWIPMWPLNQSAAGIGMAIIPFVLAAGIQLFFDRPTLRQSLILALTMGALMQVHLMSAVITAAALLPLFIGGMLTAENRVQRLIASGVAALGGLLLSLNFFATFWDVMRHNQVLGTFGVLDMYRNSTALSFGESYQSVLGLIFSIGFVFAAVYAVQRRDYPLKQRVSLLTGAAFLFLSSKMMPWDAVSTVMPGVKNVLQFPTRLLAVALPLLLAGSLALVANVWTNHRDFSPQLRRTVQITLVILFAFQPLNLMMGKAVQWQNEDGVSNQAVHQAVHMKTTTAFTPEAIHAAFADRDLGTPLTRYYNGVIDYVPIVGTGQFGTYQADNDEYERLAVQYETQVAKPTRGNRFHKWVNAAGHLVVSVKVSKAQELRLPIMMYNEFQLRLNGREVPQTAIKRNWLGIPTVHVQAGRQQFELRYVMPKYVKISLIVTLISWTIGLIGYGILTKKRHRSDDVEV